jgi:ribosomal protein S12 methylthiotransferase
LAELVDKMAEVEGIKWIRLHYAYPTDFPYDILPVMAKHKNVCKYMDIALQHCSSKMLKLMRRHITREEQDALISRIRVEVPGICIRTTLLVGHPGETEEDFNELCDWVREMRFDRLGAFAYSEEEGTFAARHYEDTIPQEEKDRRVEVIMSIQQSISSGILEQMVGTQQEVVIDRDEGDYYIGRTQYDSPEVDCEVLIAKGEKKLKNGEYYIVNIIKSEDFDLYASL